MTEKKKAAEAAPDSLAASEALSAAGATAPRVSINDIEDAIDQEFYILGKNVVLIADAEAEYPGSLNVFTICLLVLKNGFVQIGTSAPASAENFDAEKGKTFAREQAIRALWPMFGFALREKLASELLAS